MKFLIFTFFFVQLSSLVYASSCIEDTDNFLLKYQKANHSNLSLEEKKDLLSKEITTLEKTKGTLVGKSLAVEK